MKHRNETWKPDLGGIIFFGRGWGEKFGLSVCQSNETSNSNWGGNMKGHPCWNMLSVVNVHWQWQIEFLWQKWTSKFSICGLNIFYVFLFLDYHDLSICDCCVCSPDLISYQTYKMPEVFETAKKAYFLLHHFYYNYCFG